MPKAKKTGAVANAVAFLRGVNVGGNNVVPMAKVVAMIESLKLGAVRSVGHAGNILFDGGGADDDALKKKLEAGFEKKLGIACVVVVRKLDELKALVESEPFGKVKPEVTRYVALLAGAPAKDVKPTRNEKEGWDLFEIRGHDVFFKSWKVNGRSTFPIVDKLFGVPATVRNWNTVEKVTK
ncbi:MAG: DUF1697 domain-containing protein [Myxococcaceae bacterium]